MPGTGNEERGLPRGELSLVPLSQVLGTQAPDREGKPRRINAAGLCLKMRSMMAREKARLGRGRRLDPRALRLEREARRWLAQGGRCPRPMS